MVTEASAAKPTDDPPLLESSLTTSIISAVESWAPLLNRRARPSCPLFARPETGSPARSVLKMLVSKPW